LTTVTTAYSEGNNVVDITANPGLALTKTPSPAIGGTQGEKIRENLVTSTAYTLAASDANMLVTLDNAAAITLTVPANVFSAKDVLNIMQHGAGQVSVVAGAGMTILSAGGKLKLAGQYSAASILFRTPTQCELFGDIAS